MLSKNSAERARMRRAERVDEDGRDSGCDVGSDVLDDDRFLTQTCVLSPASCVLSPD